MNRSCAYNMPSMSIILILTIAIIYLLPEAHAHSPLVPGDNERLETATLIPDPTKSWAVYGELNSGRNPQYYRFNINKSQRIYVMLFKSTNPEEREFAPNFVLMGPGIDSRGDVPDYVEIPPGANAIVVAGEQPVQATYEPFSASSFYSLAELDLDAPASGTYVIAVYEPDMGGHYGLAVGYREAYSPGEWILIPINLISVYRWEGQGLAMIFAPIVATLAIGSGLIFLRKRWSPQTLSGWAGTLAGLLFTGTGAMLLFQMILSLARAPIVPEAAVTITLATVQILLGAAVLRLVLKSKEKMYPLQIRW